MLAHKPEFYVAGAFVHQKQIWLGDFEATAWELFAYAENDVKTVEEYTMVLDMLSTQQIYESWWDRTSKKFK